MGITVELSSQIHTLNPSDWNGLTDGTPLISHAFLSALETTSCVGKGTGWQPTPLLVKENGALVGAMPLYLKSHSYGEYVFDWSWADAYARNGLNYYPKFLGAIPFTPISGSRLLSKSRHIQTLMIDTLAELTHQQNLSSAHILFTDESATETLEQAGWLMRKGVQFRWVNEGFSNFEEFLATLSHDKRKKIHQERKKIGAANIVCRQLTGANIQSENWDFFYQCYEHTYFEHHSTPYLTRDFFHTIGRTMPENLLLIIAEINGKPIAAALNLFGTDHQGISTLYGRYWGSLQFVSGLHFELCYYQAQEFCIARGIQFFEGGAQGEHKLARGFKPRTTHSFHYIAHPDFAEAIERFTAQEAENIAHYQHELEERAPFKQVLTLNSNASDISKNQIE